MNVLTLERNPLYANNMGQPFRFWDMFEDLKKLTVGRNPLNPSNVESLFLFESCSSTWTNTGQNPYVCNYLIKLLVVTMLFDIMKRFTVESNHMFVSHVGKSWFILLIRNTWFFPIPSNVRNTGKKSYVGNVCAKAYTVLSSLQHHDRNHTVEKPCVCNHCAKAFFCMSLLQGHDQSHTVQRPNYVTKYVTPIYLQIYGRIHTGDSPSVGKQCYKAHMRAEPCGSEQRGKTFLVWEVWTRERIPMWAMLEKLFLFESGSET
jgi:KRAB domain-containing zinc finger protein